MKKTPYENFVRFCDSRALSVNRVYGKEILLACNVDNQTGVGMSLISNGLSFKDGYWFSDSLEQNWDSVNIYENKFSKQIAEIALTGLAQALTVTDKIVTGELCSNGTRAKCYIRDSEGILLCKHMTDKEMLVECLSYYIAEALGIKSTKYFIKDVFNTKCACCRLWTNKNTELVSARDVMLHFCEDKMFEGSRTYEYFMRKDEANFKKMQLFDFLTLNTDRNRDNYGLLIRDGKLIGMCPLFDHDSCFKGKSVDAHYFVTGKSFKKSLKNLDVTGINFDVLEGDRLRSGLQRVVPECLDGFYERVKILKGIARKRIL